FALSALAASAASAEPFSFYSEVAPPNLAGSSVGTEEFTVDAGATSCEGTSYSGVASTPEITELSLTPAFKTCTVEPFGTADITVSSCHYVLTPVTKSGGTYKAK